MGLMISEEKKPAKTRRKEKHMKAIPSLGAYSRSSVAQQGNKTSIRETKTFGTCGNLLSVRTSGSALSLFS